MRKNTLALAAIAVLSCAEAPTEAGTSQGRLVQSMASLAVTAAGQMLQVAIPDVGSALPADYVLVATGHTGPVDFSECDGNLFTVARYAVLIGTRNESYGKVHFSTNVEPGTRMSRFSSRTSCLIGGTQYQVFDVETQ